MYVLLPRCSNLPSCFTFNWTNSLSRGADSVPDQQINTEKLKWTAEWHLTFPWPVEEKHEASFPQCHFGPWLLGTSLLFRCMPRRSEASLVAQTVKNPPAMRETWVPHPWVEKMPWRRAWQQPTPVFLPGESHGQRSLVGYTPWGCKESDTTEQPNT